MQAYETVQDRKAQRSRHLARANRERKIAHVEDQETAREMFEAIRAYNVCGRIAQQFSAKDSD